jgi:hypothetical protein
MCMCLLASFSASDTHCLLAVLQLAEVSFPFPFVRLKSVIIQIPPARWYASLQIRQLPVFCAAGSVSASGNDVVDKIQRYGVKTLTDLRSDYKSRADDVRSRSQH